MYDPYGYKICKTPDKNAEIVSKQHHSCAHEENIFWREISGHQAFKYTINYIWIEQVNILAKMNL
jgi:hypothetical protein